MTDSLFRRLSWLIPAAAIGLALMPVTTAAQQGTNGALWVNSSMKAVCLDASCTRVEFTLSVAGDPPNLWVNWFRLKSYGTDWRFQDVESITDSNGNELTPETIVTGDSIWIENYSLGQEPLKIVVQMTATGAPQTLSQLTYAGFGNENANFDGQDYQFGGNVAPEPITLVLLGSGLAGVGAAGMRRRRKRQDL